MSEYRAARPPGFERLVDLETWDSALPCPRCGGGLYCGKRDEVEVDACGACGGVWLRAEHARRALATGSRAHEELARKVDRVTRARSVEHAAITCPECHAPMTTRKVGVVTLDVCDHGTWFDRSELVAVMAAMRGETAASALDALYLREQAERARWGALASVIDLFRRLLRG